MQTKLYTVPDGTRQVVEVGLHPDEKVTIGKNCTVTLLYKSSAKSPLQTPNHLAIQAGHGSGVHVFIMQSTPLILTQHIEVGPHARVDTFGVWTRQGKYTQQLILKGEGAQGYDVQVFSLKGNDTFTLKTTLEHAGTNTKGNILTKGTVDDHSYANLQGMIKVDPSGAGAASFLQENVLILNPNARADANPELEIENNDVSSRHGATVGPIDEEKVFYLMTRGSTREDARALIIDGFLRSALEKIHDHNIQEEMAKVLYGETHV